ncbi:hypothetical protein [Rossellomorea aquimaris]|uniref:hypothetical protein n=1 Tax=Rossellomorea aquimaris TaxID=189382 RepID=UPI0016536456|nr:hypothetical protein [Rossellomorea aquimaris]
MTFDCLFSAGVGSWTGLSGRIRIEIPDEEAFCEEIDPDWAFFNPDYRLLILFGIN